MISYDSNIDRLKSTLKNRLNLLNTFRKITNINHIPITFKNININTEAESEIINFILSNTEEVKTFMLGYMNQWFSKHGSEWQKNRVLEGKGIK